MHWMAEEEKRRHRLVEEERQKVEQRAWEDRQREEKRYKEWVAMLKRALPKGVKIVSTIPGIVPPIPSIPPNRFERGPSACNVGGARIDVGNGIRLDLFPTFWAQQGASGFDFGGFLIFEAAAEVSLGDHLAETDSAGLSSALYDVVRNLRMV